MFLMIQSGGMVLPTAEAASSTPTSEATEPSSCPAALESESTKTETSALALCSPQGRKREASSTATRHITCDWLPLTFTQIKSPESCRRNLDRDGLVIDWQHAASQGVDATEVPLKMNLKLGIHTDRESFRRIDEIRQIGIWRRFDHR